MFKLDTQSSRQLCHFCPENQHSLENHALTCLTTASSLVPDEISNLLSLVTLKKKNITTPFFEHANAVVDCHERRARGIEKRIQVDDQ